MICDECTKYNNKNVCVNNCAESGLYYDEKANKCVDKCDENLFID